eukprot:12607319-Heterocapsa_arctica.AAC.1
MSAGEGDHQPRLAALPVDAHPSLLERRLDLSADGAGHFGRPEVVVDDCAQRHVVREGAVHQ